MTEDQWNLWKGNLQFFGKATASISHEIKNTLAIIAESAGLLEDLILMSEKGMELKSGQLQEISQRIQRQSVRADLIVKRLNAFSHSSDELLRSIDLLELVQMVLPLAQRFSLLRGVTLEMTPDSKNVSITTDPFSLENLLCRSLDFAAARADSNKSLLINVDEDANGGRIEISGMKNLSSLSEANFPGREERMLIGHLKASFLSEEQMGRISICLPRELDRVS